MRRSRTAAWIGQLGVLVAGALVSATAAHADIQIDLGRGPVNVHVPPAYDPGVPMPLVFLLHGYTSSGAGIEAYVQLTPLADEYGFLYCTPDGTVGGLGSRFWNATDACCGFGSTVDDSSYLRALIEEIRLQLNVDDDRIWFAGHSNGGFMSYRMACDHTDRIAAIASFAGATFADPAACLPSAPCHVLQIHGTNDATILYGGGSLFGNAYPGAVQSVETWAGTNGCTLVTDATPAPLDLVANLPGAETTVVRYTDGCAAGGDAELWTMNGAGHVPSLSATFGRSIVEWFFAHPKPGAVEVPAPGAAIAGMSLLPGAPNPFREATRVRFALDQPGRVTLRVYDVAGRRVRTLLDGAPLAAGARSVTWDGRGDAGGAVAAGVYFVRLEAAGMAAARRIVRERR